VTSGCGIDALAFPSGSAPQARSGARRRCLFVFFFLRLLFALLPPRSLSCGPTPLVAGVRRPGARRSGARPGSARVAA
jgi:hypothetical protein